MPTAPLSTELKALDKALSAGLERSAKQRTPGRQMRERSFERWLKEVGSLKGLRRVGEQLARGGLFDIRCERHVVRDLDGQRFTMTAARAVSTDMWPMGTHYWVRDNALIGARFLESDSPEGSRLGKSLLLSALSFMSTVSQLKRFAAVVRSKSRRFKSDPMSWPCIFAAVEGNLNTAKTEAWSHKQDAWQMAAWHVLVAIERGPLSVKDLTPKHKKLLELIVPFLLSVDFLKVESSGSWEEAVAVRSSVRAWEHRLIAKIAELSVKSEFSFLARGFLKWRKFLAAPYRTSTLAEAVSIADRATVAAMLKDLPFESPGYPKRGVRYREGDGALIYLLMLDYPAFLAERAGKSAAWGAQLEARVLREILKLVDRKSGGIYRYAGDSYQRCGFFRNETVQVLTTLFGGPSGDASSQIARRNKLVPKGRQAAWTHFTWQLAAWAGERFLATGAKRYRQLHERFFRAGMGLITGANEVSCEVGPDGTTRIIRIPKLRMPECYIADLAPSGRELIFPSPHTPLNWAVGEMFNAFRVREGVVGRPQKGTDMLGRKHVLGHRRF